MPPLPDAVMTELPEVFVADQSLRKKKNHYTAVNFTGRFRTSHFSSYERVCEHVYQHEGVESTAVYNNNIF